MKARLENFNSMLDSSKFKGAYLALLVLAYCIAYLRSPDFPVDAVSRGWWNYWDQGKFLQCAQAIATGSLNPETYWYPIGYPALGSFFVNMLPMHPFFPINVLCVAVTACFFWRISREFLSPLQTMLVCLLCWAMLGTEMEMSLVLPWNTLPTMALAYALAWEGFRPASSPGRVLAQFILVGIVYLTRPSDAAFLLPFPVLAAFRCRDYRSGARLLVAGGVLFSLFPLAVTLLNLHIFDTIRTPYELNSQAIGFFSQPVLTKLYSLFVDGLPVFGQPQSALLARMPWLLLAPAGLAWAVKKGHSMAWAFAASAILCFLIYLGYNDFTPLNLYNFALIHYLFWMLPLLVLFAYLAVAKAAIMRPTVLAGLAVAVLGLTLVRLEAVHCCAGDIDTQGRVVLAHGADQPADAAVVGALAPLPLPGSVAVANGAELRPFRDYLLWNDSLSAHVYFTRKLAPDAIRFIPQALHGRPVAFKNYRWTMRDVDGYSELALRLLGNNAVFVSKPRTVLRACEEGTMGAQVAIEASRFLTAGAKAWFVSMSTVGAFSSCALPLPFTGHLDVATAPTGPLSDRITLSFKAPFPTAEKVTVTVSPLDANGNPLLFLTATTRSTSVWE